MILFNILSIALIIIILYTYYYLVELKNCPCFIQNKEENLNLEYMKFYTILDLFTILVSLFFIKHVKKIGIEKTSNVLVIFSVLLVAFIHGYMTYNVYHFYNSVKSNCQCVNQWQKYYIYYEGIVSSLVSLQYTISFLLILIMLINTRS